MHNYFYMQETTNANFNLLVLDFILSSSVTETWLKKTESCTFNCRHSCNSCKWQRTEPYCRCYRLLKILTQWLFIWNQYTDFYFEFRTLDKINVDVILYFCQAKIGLLVRNVDLVQNNLPSFCLLRERLIS